MLGNYFTFPELLLWCPLVTGLIAFFYKRSKKGEGLGFDFFSCHINNFHYKFMLS